MPSDPVISFINKKVKPSTSVGKYLFECDHKVTKSMSVFSFVNKKVKPRTSVGKYLFKINHKVTTTISGCY